MVKCRACVSAVLRCSVHFSSDEMQGPKCAYFSRGVAKVESYEKRLIFHWFLYGLVTLEKKLQNRCREDEDRKVAQMQSAKTNRESSSAL